MATIDELFKIMVEQNASDLHLTSGAPPYLRVHGSMVPMNYRDLNSQEVQSLIFEILSDKQKKMFVEKQVCTMKGATEFCSIPSPRG